MLILYNLKMEIQNEANKKIDKKKKNEITLEMRLIG
jgi:hypothetical protein